MSEAATRHEHPSGQQWSLRHGELEATVVEGVEPLLGPGVVTSLVARTDRGRSRR